MSVTINKNGRNFIVECIIFQDASFEISINDVTQEEEQVRLKRQADTKYRPRTENAGKQYPRISGNDCQQRKHLPREDEHFPRTLLCTEQPPQPSAT